MLTETPLQKAVRLAGSQSELARRIDSVLRRSGGGPKGGKVRQGYVGKWLQKGRVPDYAVIPIEVAVDGGVTRHELRPDLYPTDPPPRRPAEAEVQTL